jgi:hypothetical protein
MRLYPKKLRNIEDLEREKKLLRKESRDLDIDSLFSVDGILGKKNKDKDDGGSLFDFLPVSNPVVDLLVKFVQKKLAKKNGDSGASYAPPPEKKKKGKNLLKTVAVEFIGGYLKWKAIELSYKGIRHLIKKRKEKNAAQQEQ